MLIRLTKFTVLCRGVAHLAAVIGDFVDKKCECPHCGRRFSEKGIGTHIWRTHGSGKDFDPNRGYRDGTRVPWNKGLTKETNSSVAAYAKKLSRIKSELELRLDDDGKLKDKWKNKRVNAAKEGIEFTLSYEDYLNLVADANLKSSQLGFTGAGYVLARYNDEGGYTKGNCRFITQKENSDEKNRRLFWDKH